MFSTLLYSHARCWAEQPVQPANHMGKVSTGTIASPLHYSCHMTGVCKESGLSCIHLCDQHSSCSCLSNEWMDEFSLGKLLHFSKLPFPLLHKSIITLALSSFWRQLLGYGRQYLLVYLGKGVKNHWSYVSLFPHFIFFNVYLPEDHQPLLTGPPVSELTPFLIRTSLPPLSSNRSSQECPAMNNRLHRLG